MCVCVEARRSTKRSALDFINSYFLRRWAAIGRNDSVPLISSFESLDPSGQKSVLLTMPPFTHEPNCI